MGCLELIIYYNLDFIKITKHQSTARLSIMMRLVQRSLFRGVAPLFRFTEAKQPATSAQQQSSLLKQEQKQHEIPVHLRPYDKKKYQVPSTKMKVNSGYALLDIEPFPRARIMRLSYNLLEKLRDIPEEAMYRMYTEEKIKYIMKIVDETEDIQLLEEKLGATTIEYFIWQLAGEFELLEIMKVEKPWIKHELEEGERILIHGRKVEPQNPRYNRGPRVEKKFIEEGGESKSA